MAKDVEWLVKISPPSPPPPKLCYFQILVALEKSGKQEQECLNPLPDDKILDRSKLKQFAGDI